MKTLLKISFFAILLNLLLTASVFAAAAGPADPAQNPLYKQQKDVLDKLGGDTYGAAKNTADAQTALAGKIGSAAGIVLSFLGVIFLFYVVYAGIQWMTAGGNEQQVENARERIVRATIGMVIVASAWGISSFIITKIQTNQTTGNNAELATCESLNNPDNDHSFSCFDEATCNNANGTITDQGTCTDGKICCNYLNR